MEACDCCGKRVDERSMATVADGSNAFLSHGPYMVCQACRGVYEDEELLEKCKEQAAESGKPN
jgi:hypothetical protein